jgi:hypothetical protein
MKCRHCVTANGGGNGFIVLGRFYPSKLERCFVLAYSAGEGRGAYRVLVGRPEGKRPLGKHRRRWENNILRWTLGK